MKQVKQLDFTGSTIYCGIDVHKNNWRINIQDSNFELEDFSQDANAELLYKHLIRKYPGADFKLCYEAGFSGFGVQRYLSSKGMHCMVINAADVATTNKEKVQKTDKLDARKLCEHIQTKKAKGIYIPEREWEYGRSLIRVRAKIVRDLSRCKHRIWQLLYSSGLEIPKGYKAGQYWSKRFVNDLKAIECGDIFLRQALDIYIQEFELIKSLLLTATRNVGNLCKHEQYVQQITFLRSIPGIGLINAAVILFELQKVQRFKHFDQLCSYCGLVPSTYQSGQTNITRGITCRKNNFLRIALVESSWHLVRKDPALLMKYKNYTKRMHSNKAIIRIAKHLLSRINFVLKNQTQYITGIV